MDPIVVIVTLMLLQVKHLLVDWIWQPPYEHKNKHIFLHWGGIRHALKNAIGTGVCIALGFWGHIGLATVIAVTVLDFLAHYHIDLGKTNLNRRMGYCPTQHPQFWWLTGFDQFLHQITYLALLMLIVGRIV